MLAMGRHKHTNYSSQPTLLLKTQQCINTHRTGFDNGVIVHVTLSKTPKQELGVCVIQQSYVFHCQGTAQGTALFPNITVYIPKACSIYTRQYDIL